MRPRAGREIADRGRDVAVAGDVRAGVGFLGADFLHRGGSHEGAGFLDGFDGDAEICGVGECTVVEDGWGGGVGGVDGNGAAAERFEYHNGYSVTAAESDFLSGGVG